MTEPVLFLSHLRIKEGAAADALALTSRVTDQLRVDKPLTAAFLCFLTEDRRELTIVHVFADADAMDRHFEGSDQRASAAYQLFEQVGWEFYGRPSEQAMAAMRNAAEKTGASLRVAPEFVAGFLRIGG